MDFEPPDEEKDRRMMTFEERVEAAERRRVDGNAAFQAGQYGEAMSKYRCGSGAVLSWAVLGWAEDLHVMAGGHVALAGLCAVRCV